MNQNIDIDLQNTLLSLFLTIKEDGLCDIDSNLELKFFKKNSKKGTFNKHNYRVNAYYSAFENKILMRSPIFFEHSIITLCHEVIHAEQFHTKKLDVVDYNRRKWFTWHGKRKIRVIDVCNLKIDEYKNLPWESEAYGNERNLARKILNKYNEKGNKEYASVL